MIKTKLREKYRAMRLIIAADDFEESSLKICQRVFREVDWDKVGKICSYDPIGELKEVDVKPLLQAIEYKFPYKKITILKQSKKQKAPKTKFDLILVPCLAFDKDNYRLGWGGGFYDRFLADQPQSYKVGLCFQSGFVKDGLPREDHDIPLDMIVTER